MNLKKIISAVTAFALSATMMTGFAVTANAADETVLYEKGTSDTTAWTSDDLTSWTQSGGTYSLDDTCGPMLTGSNSAHSATMTVSPAANAIIKIDAVAYLNSGLNRNIADGNYSYFKFGNIYVMQNDQTKKSAYSLDGGTTYTEFAASGVTYRAAWASVVPHTIHMEIDTSTNTLTTLTVNGETKVSNTVLSDANYTTVAFGYARTKSVSSTQTEALKSIKITQTEQTVTKADYNIKYVIPADGDTAATEIKTVPLNGVVGTAPVVDTADFEVDGQRYICDSNDASGKTIESDGSTVVTVNCHAAATYAMKVETSSGAEIKSENVVEHDSLTYSFSKYLTDENNKVTYTADNTAYTVTTTPTASGTITVPYTAYTGTAYFAENGGLTGTNLADSKLSGGYAVRGINDTAGKTVMTVKENGIYTFTSVGCTNNVGKSSAMTFYKNSVSDENKIGDTVDLNYASVNKIATTAVENVALSASDTILVVASDSNVALDYVLLTKTAELPVVTTGLATSVEGTSFPTIDSSAVFTNAADDTDTATYSDLTTGKTVKTVYAKVQNSTQTPVIKIGDAVQTSKWTAVGTTGIYFAQFVGAEADFAEGGAFETVTITCDSAAPVTVNWAE